MTTSNPSIEYCELKLILEVIIKSTSITSGTSTPPAAWAACGQMSLDLGPLSFQAYESIKSYIDYAKDSTDLSIVAGGKCDDR